MSNVYGRIIGAIFLLGCSAWFGHWVTDNQWQSKWDAAEKQAAQNQLKAVNDAVKDHNKRIEELTRVNDETKKSLAQAFLDADRANSDADGLSKSFTDSLRRPSTCDKTAPTVRELAAAATNQTVQAYLFERTVRLATEYAKIADDNRIRGLSCQAEYGVLTTRF